MNEQRLPRCVRRRLFRFLTRSLHSCLLSLALLFPLGLRMAAQAVEVTIERDVAVRMRDGIELHADIYRPKAEGKYPVLLQRTPYNKQGDDSFGRKAAERGYVCIVQDVRGRYSSPGEWYTFKNEPNDGYDTIEWAATLPYSDGRVGMFGGSYVGATQMLAAIAQPPHLAGILPVVTASNYHDGWTYQGGAFEQWFDESWTSGLAQDTLAHRVHAATHAKDLEWTLPLSDYPVLKLDAPQQAAHAVAPYFFDWLAHPNYDAYWRQWSIEEHYAQIGAPALHVGGWYDIFLRGTLRNYNGLRAHAASENARRNQRLVIGPWYHGPFTGKTGALEFPNANVEESDMVLPWYDFLFKQQQNEMARQKPVRIYVMGLNQWREEGDWPLARAHATRYYLHSSGHANSKQGDGTLSATPPATETADKFNYDPAKPVPTVGGPLCCDNEGLASGAFDQSDTEARPDVLVYSTPPFTQDTEVTGPVSAELYVRSSAVDSDITGKLVDVWPNGFAQNLCEGILRLRYRDSQDQPSLLTPGQIYKVTVDMVATSNVFRAGHRLRLEISSSNFPRFDRNLNSGEDIATASHMKAADNTIYHDPQHPSALIVAVIP